MVTGGSSLQKLRILSILRRYEALGYPNAARPSAKRQKKKGFFGLSFMRSMPLRLAQTSQVPVALTFITPGPNIKALKRSRGIDHGSILRINATVEARPGFCFK